MEGGPGQGLGSADGDPTEVLRSIWRRLSGAWPGGSGFQNPPGPVPALPAARRACCPFNAESSPASGSGHQQPLGDLVSSAWTVPVPEQRPCGTSRATQRPSRPLPPPRLQRSCQTCKASRMSVSEISEPKDLIPGVLKAAWMILFLSLSSCERAKGQQPLALRGGGARPPPGVGGGRGGTPSFPA